MLDLWPSQKKWFPQHIHLCTPQTPNNELTLTKYVFTEGKTRQSTLTHLVRSFHQSGMPSLRADCTWNTIQISFVWDTFAYWYNTPVILVICVFNIFIHYFVSLFCWVLGHINLWRLFNAKSIFIQINSSISNRSI